MATQKLIQSVAKATGLTHQKAVECLQVVWEGIFDVTRHAHLLEDHRALLQEQGDRIQLLR